MNNEINSVIGFDKQNLEELEKTVRTSNHKPSWDECWGKVLIGVVVGAVAGFYCYAKGKSDARNNMTASDHGKALRSFGI